jgi:uncharacterized protein YjbJ (UPF0337 family)
MNQDTIRGNWRQFRGKLKAQWGRLTDDDLDIIDGRRDQLVGVLQKREGIERKDAENLVSDWETDNRYVW